MRGLDEQFERYAAVHQTPVNRAIHGLCTPAIAFGLIAALWTIPPVLPGWFNPGLWAVLAMFAAFLFYRRLSRNLAWAMAAALIVAGALARSLYAALGGAALLQIATALGIAGCAGELVGHAIEGRRPACVRDPSQLLIGPAWWMAKLLRRLGVTW